MHEGVICRDDAERSRLLDMSRRLRPADRRVGGMWAICAAVAVPVYGWLPLLPLLGGVVLAVFGHRLIPRPRRRERAVVISWAIVTLLTAAWVALSDGPRLPLLSVLVVPALTAAVMFGVRVAAATATAIVALLVALGFGLDPAGVHATPGGLIVPVAVVVAVAMIGALSSAADAASRSTALVDQLTGVLNRTALEARVIELAHHAELTGAAIAVLVGDLDGFKAINDEHGHATGDRMLIEAAARLQAALGAGETVYRFGGEEFVVLLPGLDAATAARVAERLRAAVGATPVHGVALTISFGVAVSAPGAAFDYRAAFGHADAALYEAKTAGRDRVAIDAGDAGAPPLRHERRALRRDVGPPADVAAGGWDERIARERSEAGNWLIESTAQREHMLDLNQRVANTGVLAIGLALLAVLSAVPAIGWWPVLPLVVFATVDHVVSVNARRMRRPEYWLLASLVVAQAGYGLGFVLAAGDPILGLPLLVVTIAVASAVFPPRGTMVAAIVTAVIMGVVAAIVGPSEVASNPMLLIIPLAVLGGVSFVGAAVWRSAVDHRGAAIVDRLTGMFTRVALQTRVSELSHRAATTGEDVSLIVGDVDHFKAINDHHGHVAGDVALTEIAHRIVGELRAFEPAYRIGGEEFLIVLAGVDVAAAAATAERLRTAVAGLTVAGAGVTMSFGVSGSMDTEPFDYARVFARADAALYEAKRGGRNRVCVRGAPDRPGRLAA